MITLKDQMTKIYTKSDGKKHLDREEAIHHELNINRTEIETSIEKYLSDTIGHDKVIQLFDRINLTPAYRHTKLEDLSRIAMNIATSEDGFLLEAANYAAELMDAATKEVRE